MRTNERNLIRTKGATMRSLSRVAACTALLAMGACELDLTNPNSPREDVVLNTPDGIIALAVGMQGQFAGTGVGTGMVLNAVRAPALVTDEWGTTSRALAADRSLQTGAGVDGTFGVVVGPYATAFRVIRSAEELLANAGGVGLTPGMVAGIRATALAFKGMSLGILAGQYQQAPVTADTGPNELFARGIVLDSAIALLERARAELGSVTTGELADFRARVQGPAFDLGNVINGMLARYYLFDGQYALAAEAALRVNLARIEQFTYPDPNRNPIWGYTVSLQYTAGLNEFVTEAEPADQRPAYWLRTDLPTSTGNPAVLLRTMRQYQDRNSNFPIFLPDEMRLIRAEAAARAGDFEAARTLLNQVRTQCGVATEPAGCLPAKTAAEMDTLDEALAAIAYERRYELYLQGVRWEDVRRLGGAVAGETPSIAFLPLPQGECVYNPSAPCCGFRSAAQPRALPAAPAGRALAWERRTATRAHARDAGDGVALPRANIGAGGGIQPGSTTCPQPLTLRAFLPPQTDRHRPQGRVVS